MARRHWEREVVPYRRLDHTDPNPCSCLNIIERCMVETELNLNIARDTDLTTRFATLQTWACGTTMLP